MLVGVKIMWNVDRKLLKVEWVINFGVVGDLALPCDSAVCKMLLVETLKLSDAVVLILFCNVVSTGKVYVAL
jgi:hypothetical protein